MWVLRTEQNHQKIEYYIRLIEVDHMYLLNTMTHVMRNFFCLKNVKIRELYPLYYLNWLSIYFFFLILAFTLNCYKFAVSAMSYVKPRLLLDQL